MLGRIVALAATLEYKILVFYQYLVGRRQDVFTELQPSGSSLLVLKRTRAGRPHRRIVG